MFKLNDYQTITNETVSWFKSILYVLLIFLMGWAGLVCAKENNRIPGGKVNINNIPGINQIRSIDKIIQGIRNPGLESLKERIYYSNMNVIERVKQEPLKEKIYSKSCLVEPIFPLPIKI